MARSVISQISVVMLRDKQRSMVKTLIAKALLPALLH